MTRCSAWSVGFIPGLAIVAANADVGVGSDSVNRNFLHHRRMVSGPDAKIAKRRKSAGISNGRPALCRVCIYIEGFVPPIRPQA
jgi:hypothetical protein